MNKKHLGQATLVLLSIFVILWPGYLYYKHTSQIQPITTTEASTTSPIAAASPHLAPLHKSTTVNPELNQTLALTIKPPPPTIQPKSPPSIPTKVTADPSPTTPQLPQASYPTSKKDLTAMASTTNIIASALISADAYALRAENASRKLDTLIRRGYLQAQFVGSGNADAMVIIALTNPTKNTINFQLYPGMILRPASDEQVQPLMLNEETQVTLAPGTSIYRELTSFCMDSRVPAPAPDTLTDYHFATRTQEGGTATVKVLQQAQLLALTPTIMPQNLQRQAVTQLALWTSMRQPVGRSQILSVMGQWSDNKAVCQTIFNDVKRVLRAVQGRDSPR